MLLSMSVSVYVVANHLQELTDWLLSPLLPLEVEAAQNDFGIYAVVHITEDQSMSDVETLAHSLALLEEPLHASHAEPLNQVTQEYLNSHHAIFLSTHTSIHLVQDQAAPEGFDTHPYNAQRLDSIRTKYFCPMSLRFSKTALTRIDVAACEVLYNELGDERFRQVRSHLMHLGVTSRFSVLSRRPAVQRSYDLSVVALRLPEHRASTRQVITDLADHYHQEQLLHSQHLATESLESGHHIHKALAWVEVAIVGGAYGAELYHLVLDDKGFHPANLIAAIGFGILGLLIVRPWKH